MLSTGCAGSTPTNHQPMPNQSNQCQQKLENLLHTFFGNACLDIETADKNGKMCKPREWFIAPFEAIEFAVNGLLDGSIVDYRYDPIRERVTKE